LVFDAAESGDCGRHHDHIDGGDDREECNETQPTLFAPSILAVALPSRARRNGWTRHVIEAPEIVDRSGLRAVF
jgi:hypothetical protein